MGRLNLIALAISRGRVTEKYPFATIDVPDDYRGKPVIDCNLCTGCGACANVCPSQAIEVHQDGEFRVVHLFIGRCIFCGRCQDVCPEGAIKLTKEFELATQNPEDLHQFVKLRMIKCAKCGRPFDTYRHLLRVIRDSPSYLDRDILLLCPECRAKRPVRWMEGEWNEC